MAAKKKAKKTKQTGKKKAAKKSSTAKVTDKGGRRRTAKKRGDTKKGTKKGARRTQAPTASAAAGSDASGAKPLAGSSAQARGRKAKAEKARLDRLTLHAIEGTARSILRATERRQKPELKFPVRSLSNVRYDARKGYFEIGRSRKSRTLTYNTAKGFAQTLKLMSLSKYMVETDDFATKRDAYYQSKNWGPAMFNKQEESDTVMDDIEAMFALDGVTREQLRFYPEEHGGAVSGQLIVIDRDYETGEEIRIDCTRFGSGAYTIPHSVEQLRFETDAKFILAIETGGMFQRLASHKFWRRERCILVSMGGVPTRATRRFIRRLSDEKKIPVYAFVDCDPYGISNIYRTLKVGSGNAAHINKFFCVPQARFLGVQPQDIIDFKLENATHKLQEVDIKRAKDALKNDPFFRHHKAWQKALNQMLSMGVRAEQQALTKWGLNYVIEEYLPRKLANPQAFLP
ncbi:MAG: DNA topoisomerase VI [Deltaproteobacteria bacterium]|nr:MAG: DNA topoisomerase VI [Deltaproteobacteria bacterium]